jgi:hypothetical protein
MFGHLHTPVPGERATHVLGQGSEGVDDASGHRRSGLVVGKVDQDQIATRAFDKSAYAGVVLCADDEIAFLTLLVLPVRLNLGDRWPSGSGYG